MRKNCQTIVLKIYLSRISRIDRYLNDLYVYSILWATFLLWKCIINWMEKYWEVFSIHVSGCEKAVSTVQHDNVAFGFATYLHVKGVANKQEAGLVPVLFVGKNRSWKKKFGGRGGRGEVKKRKGKKGKKEIMFQNVSHNRVNICIYLCVTLN